MIRTPRYFEDFQVGEKLTTPSRTMSVGVLDVAVGIGGYLAPPFLDEEVAKRTPPFGTRVAPGRVILFLMGGLIEQSELWSSEVPLALVGINNVRIRAPLRVGDTIKVEAEVTQKKETSNPTQGIIVNSERCINQHGEVILEGEAVHLVAHRPSGEK